MLRAKSEISASTFGNGRYYMKGPLLFDGQKSVILIDGKTLDLGEDGYNALYILAKRAGEFIAFEELYKAVWNPPDGTDRRAEARSDMANVIERLGAAAGIVKVKYEPEKGFMMELDGM